MKHKILCTALGLLASCTLGWSQTSYEENLELLKSHLWTDGYEFVKYVSPFDASEVFDIPISLEDNKTLLMYEGSLYRGGNCLFLKSDGHAIQVDEEEFYPWFPAGDILAFDNEMEILFLKDTTDNQIHNILKTVSDLHQLKEMIKKNMLRLGLAGSYTDAAGKSYKFSSTEFKAEGFPFKDQHFDFGNIQKIPQFILVFKEGTFAVDQLPEGLRLVPVCYNSSRDKYDILPDKEVLELKRMPSTYEYPLLSEEYFTRIELALYGGSPYDMGGHIKSEKKLKEFMHALAVMRNEILARHGYIFPTEEWSTYFAEKSWYKPTQKEVTNQLSKIEKANIQLIRYLEKKYTKQIQSH